MISTGGVVSKEADIVEAPAKLKNKEFQFSRYIKNNYGFNAV
jgi:hypothetical protein